MVMRRSTRPVRPSAAGALQLADSDFNDITTGSNGGFNAGTGYDLVTGLGTPMADLLVPDLAAYNGTVQSDRTVTVFSGASGSNDGSYGSANAVSYGPANAFTIFDAEIAAPSGMGSAMNRGPVSLTNNAALDRADAHDSAVRRADFRLYAGRGGREYWSGCGGDEREHCSGRANDGSSHHTGADPGRWI